MVQLKQNFEAYRAHITASVAQNRVHPNVPYATFESWITSILTNVGAMIDAASARNAPSYSAPPSVPPKLYETICDTPQNTAIFEMQSATVLPQTNIFY